jgi:hypothetical protein
MERMTKRDYFNALLVVDGVRENAELTAFINKELALLDRKKATKAENPDFENIRTAILSNIADDEQLLAKEITERLNNSGVRTAKGEIITTQKIVPILIKLYEKNELNKIMDKKRTLWSKSVRV